MFLKTVAQKGLKMLQSAAHVIWISRKCRFVNT